MILVEKATIFRQKKFSGKRPKQWLGFLHFQHLLGNILFWRVVSNSVQKRERGESIRLYDRFYITYIENMRFCRTHHARRALMSALLRWCVNHFVKTTIAKVLGLCTDSFDAIILFINSVRKTLCSLLRCGIMSVSTCNSFVLAIFHTTAA